LQLHHADKFNGVPYGIFLGPKVSQDIAAEILVFRESTSFVYCSVFPVHFTVICYLIPQWTVLQELEEVGGGEELDKLVKAKNNNAKQGSTQTGNTL
jgi:hypothetical protein